MNQQAQRTSAGFNKHKHAHTEYDTLPLVSVEPVRTTNTTNTRLISNFISSAALALQITEKLALRGSSAVQL